MARILELFLLPIFLVFAQSTVAQSISIVLEIQASDDFVNIINVDDGVEVQLFFRTTEGQNILPNKLEIKPNKRLGTIVGRRAVQLPPKEAQFLCFDFLDKKAKAGFLIWKTCEPINFAAFQTDKYTTNRGVNPKRKHFRTLRSELVNRIKVNTSGDTSLIERTNETMAFFRDIPVDFLGVPEARLIAHLLKRSAKNENRIHDLTLFELAEKGSSDMHEKLRTLARLAELTKNNSTPSDILFEAYISIDLEEYAKGQPEFLDDYFSTLVWLAEQRVLVRKTVKGLGSNVSKEFSGYCKDRVPNKYKDQCLRAFESASNILIGSLINIKNRLVKKNFKVALKSYHDAGVISAKSRKLSKSADKPIRRPINSRILINQYKNSICGPRKACILP